MPITKTRINISVSNSVRDALVHLARRERIPRATKAAHLLEAALEIEEDQLWEERAQKRDTKGAVYLPHTNVWK